MAVVKQAVFLLLLLAVSAYADHHLNHTNHAGHTDHGDHGDHADHADPQGHADHADCENLNKTLHSKDLHKSFGNWVLVHSVAERGEDVVRNLSSSHSELRLLNDNKTFSYNQWNKYIDGSCDNYFVKLSLAENHTNHDHHTVPINGHYLEKNGELKWYNETGELQFFQTCDDCLLTIYKGEGRRFLFNFRRQGHHSNVEQLRAHDDHHDRLAKCLGFSHEETYRYDGVAEHCSKETPKSLNEYFEHHDHHDH